MTHVTSISTVIRVVPHQLTVPLTCRGLYQWSQSEEVLSFSHCLAIDIPHWPTLYISTLQMPLIAHFRKTRIRMSHLPRPPSHTHTPSQQFWIYGCYSRSKHNQRAIIISGRGNQVTNHGPSDGERGGGERNQATSVFGGGGGGIKYVTASKFMYYRHRTISLPDPH